MPFLPNSTPFTVFDLETTGLSPGAGDRIVEVAGVRIERGTIERGHPFLSLVNPEREIPWEARRIHRIPQEDLHSAPTIMEVLPRFLGFAQGSILVAHNAEFDMGFLAVEKELCWGYVEIPECLCTMHLSKSVFPHESCHTLHAVSQRLQLPPPPVCHRALPDVFLAAHVFLKLVEQAGIRSLEELRMRAGLRRAPCR